ncbi:MAG TPA: hypothetical protein VN228_16115 [Pyrinomonadaceae bacterium]|nr:hypothetical protein [Pyrinomonadaceae bacterium]
MNKRKAVEIGVLLLTVGGGGLIAIMSVRGDLEKAFPFLPPYFYRLCLLVGFPVAVLGILLIVLPLGTIQNVVRWWRRHWDKPYDCKTAKWEDLKAIHSFATEELGQVSDLQKMERWFQTNRQIFWIITDKSAQGPREKQLVGYYAVLPLNKEASDLLGTEQIEGISLAPEHLIPYRRGRIRKTPASIYVGGIVSKKGPRVRHFVLGSLIGHLNQEKLNGVKTVFSRPVTDDGLRLVKKYGFRPVSRFVNGYQMNHIYKFEFRDDDQ